MKNARITVTSRVNLKNITLHITVNPPINACAKTVDDCLNEKQILYSMWRHTERLQFLVKSVTLKRLCKKYLKEHMKSHENKLPYACTICNKRFLWRSGLRARNKKNTPEGVSNECWSSYILFYVHYFVSGEFIRCTLGCMYVDGF